MIAVKINVVDLVNTALKYSFKIYALERLFSILRLHYFTEGNNVHYYIYSISINIIYFAYSDL